MMIRSSVFPLVVLSALGVACVAPAEREELGYVSSAAEGPYIDSGLEDPTEPIVDVPGLPPGYIVPSWGACTEDGSRAPRTFVRVAAEHREKGAPCPRIKGETGEWIGAPVASVDSSFCSYVWREDSYSEFFKLGTIASRTALNRSKYESEQDTAWSIPTRADIRPDCMLEVSPCIFMDGRVNCRDAPVTRDELVWDSAKLQKGMSPCGACGEMLGDNELLVVLPEWFARIDREGGLRDVRINIRDRDVPDVVRSLEVEQPAGEQAFLVKVPPIKTVPEGMKVPRLTAGAEIFVSR